MGKRRYLDQLILKLSANIQVILPSLSQNTSLKVNPISLHSLTDKSPSGLLLSEVILLMIFSFIVENVEM